MRVPCVRQRTMHVPCMCRARAMHVPCARVNDTLSTAPSLYQAHLSLAEVVEGEVGPVEEGGEAGVAAPRASDRVLDSTSETFGIRYIEWDAS